MLFVAVRGGEKPHSSSTRRSTETTSLVCRSRTARSDRCLTPPSSSLRPASRISSGPSRRNSTCHRRVADRNTLAHPASADGLTTRRPGGKGSSMDDKHDRLREAGIITATDELPEAYAGVIDSLTPDE